VATTPTTLSASRAAAVQPQAHGPRAERRLEQLQALLEAGLGDVVLAEHPHRLVHGVQRQAVTAELLGGQLLLPAFGGHGAGLARVELGQALDQPVDLVAAALARRRRAQLQRLAGAPHQHVITPVGEQSGADHNERAAQALQQQHDRDALRQHAVERLGELAERAVAGAAAALEQLAGDGIELRLALDAAPQADDGQQREQRQGQGQGLVERVAPAWTERRDDQRWPSMPSRPGC
jgi:hypothetical protein